MTPTLQIKNLILLSLNISKTQLASLLGTIPETLSRILRKMADQGLIDVAGRKIKLLDIDGLEILAQTGRVEDFGT